MMYIFSIYWNFVCLFKGVDEATIIDILTKRTNAQRQQIKAAYQQAKGKVKYIKPSLIFTQIIKVSPGSNGIDEQR